MKPFTSANAVIRQIWGSTDIVLFIFAGAAAEFALNKQVDWLYFTGKLPTDPIKRLFSTVRYAQQIIFEDGQNAQETLTQINEIHEQVILSRRKNIPEAAYLDVLYLLIHYSIASFELLERKLTIDEKNEIIATFHSIGSYMHLKDIPGTYEAWLIKYALHKEENLFNSFYTKDLFKQYRKRLGGVRYLILLDIQRLIVSDKVNQLLDLGSPGCIRIIISIYKRIRKYRISGSLIRMMVPQRFKSEIRHLERFNFTKKLDSSQEGRP